MPRWHSLFLAALLAACAPTLQPLGPSVQEPSMNSTSYVTPDGVSLPLRRWLPEKEKPEAVVLALHGFNDYSRSFDMPARAWQAAGIATYAYDQRGFGQSAQPGIWAGQETLASDVRAAALALRRMYPEIPLYVLGESMGGAMVIHTLTSGEGFRAAQPDGFILSAPATWGRETMPVLHRLALWVTLRTIPGVSFRPPQDLNIRATDNLEVLKDLGNDPLFLKGSRVDTLAGLVDLMDSALAAAPQLSGTPPMLVLYGHHEEVLESGSVKTFLSRLPESGTGGPVIASYENGWHMLMRDLQAPVVWKDLAAWMESRGSIPLPSGADRVAWKSLKKTARR
ncbi:MAG: lysophospholipase [Pseudomonadota bacterium]|nr:lysophospholipase [Pseudomonadota bacterium]